MAFERYITAMPFLMIFLLLPLSVFAQDEIIEQDTAPEPYMVQNVVIDVTADNAVSARAQAFEKASEVSVKAFLEAQGASPDLNGVDPDSLVRDFRVDEERFSDTRYKARFTYRLRPRPTALLANQSLPAGRQLPVPAPLFQEEAQPQSLVTGENVILDPDAPWQPDQNIVQETPQLHSWALTVRFSQVPDWLLAQNLIRARPEVRGFKITSVTSNFGILDVTSNATPERIVSQWGALGWRIAPGAGGLVLDAETMR